MQDQLTAMQEKFCLTYVETGNASEAYRQAYNTENYIPSSVHVNACKLLADAKVLQRVEALQAEHQQRHNVTLDSLTKELDEMKLFAVDKEQPSAAISAVMGKAKIHGFDKTVMEVKLPKVVRRNLAGKDNE